MKNYSPLGDQAPEYILPSKENLNGAPIWWRKAVDVVWAHKRLTPNNYRLLWSLEWFRQTLGTLAAQLSGILENKRSENSWMMTFIFLLDKSIKLRCGADDSQNPSWGGLYLTIYSHFDSDSVHSSLKYLWSVVESDSSWDRDCKGEASDVEFEEILFGVVFSRLYLCRGAWVGCIFGGCGGLGGSGNCGGWNGCDGCEGCEECEVLSGAI